jgi:uncharacterized membrane protein YheB (UPF0754 family)
MTKSEIEFVTTLVGKTLNTPAAEAASLLFEIKEDGSGDLKDTALQALLDKDSARIQKIKDEGKTLFDNGYKKAQGEALTKFEKDLKEKFGITTDKQGVELIELVVTEKLKSQGGELDDEKIKRSSAYLAMVDKLTKEKADAVKAETDKFNELQTSIQRESTFSEISKAAEKIINELNPILPESKEKANAQINRLIKELGSEYSFEIKDGKTIVLKDGKVLEDKHGHMVDFKEIVKSKASEVWDFKQGQQRQSAGNNNNAGGNGDGNKGYAGPIPKNADEYMEMIKSAPDDATKQEITKVWTAQK